MASRLTGAWLWITVDHDAGVALIRGAEAKRTVHMLALHGEAPQWTSIGRGWVVPVHMVDDIVAYAKVCHQWVAVGKRKPVGVA